MDQVTDQREAERKDRPNVRDEDSPGVGQRTEDSSPKKGAGSDREGAQGPNDADENPNAKREDSRQRQGDEQPKPPPLYKRTIPMLIISGVVVLVIVIGVLWWLHARHFESTDDAFIDGHVVTISPNVSATVLAVHMDDNWHVKKGDLLVELDPRDYQVVVAQMAANLAGAQDRVQAAQAQVGVAVANVAQSRAELVVAQTNATNAQSDYERFASLNVRSRSQQQLDNASAATKGAAAQVEQAKAKLAASEASVADAQSSIKTAQSAVKRADADLRQARINLDYCGIRAPADGMVTRKTVEPGTYVQKGDPLFALVPTDVWVTANYKETQLDLMRPGQDVRIEVDAYSGRTFHGRVDSIQNGTGSKFALLPAENATGNYVKIVQRIPVKIIFDPGEIDNAKVLLAPGMSVESRVKVR